MPANSAIICMKILTHLHLFEVGCIFFVISILWSASWVTYFHNLLDRNDIQIKTSHIELVFMQVAFIA